MRIDDIQKYEFKGVISLLGSLDGSPGLLAEGASVLLLRGPLADAVRVVGVVAGAPGDHAGLAVRDLVRLALQARLVDAVLADRAVLHCHVPAPQRHRVPLLHLDALVDLHNINMP